MAIDKKSDFQDILTKLDTAYSNHNSNDRNLFYTI